MGVGLVDIRTGSAKEDILHNLSELEIMTALCKQHVENPVMFKNECYANRHSARLIHRWLMYMRRLVQEMEDHALHDTLDDR